MDSARFRFYRAGLGRRESWMLWPSRNIYIYIYNIYEIYRKYHKNVFSEGKKAPAGAVTSILSLYFTQAWFLREKKPLWALGHQFRAYISQKRVFEGKKSPCGRWDTNSELIFHKSVFLLRKNLCIYNIYISSIFPIYYPIYFLCISGHQCTRIGGCETWPFMG